MEYYAKGFEEVLGFRSKLPPMSDYRWTTCPKSPKSQDLSTSDCILQLHPKYSNNNHKRWLTDHVPSNKLMP